MMERIIFKVPDQLHTRLENIVEELGLSKSEISRRGLLNELSKLEEQVEA